MIRESRLLVLVVRYSFVNEALDKVVCFVVR